MKTVYLLKNCPKSFGALLKLVKMGEITTNIVIVDKFYCKILKKDKRVKQFPFIINTFPTIKGLIPKIATVIPFKFYLANLKYARNKCINNRNKYSPLYNYDRTITYKPPILQKNPKKPVSVKKFCKKPIIKAVKQKDESINIILYNK
jgi:hypothetical protein